METYNNTIYLAFDLYGTLVLPPPQQAWHAQMGKHLHRIRSIAGQEALQQAITGFPLAPAVTEMRIPLDQARRLYLTARFESDEAFIELLASRFANAGPVSLKTLSSARAFADFTLSHTTLAPCTLELLHDLTEQGVVLQMVSDVSSSLSQIVQTTGICNWFPEPLFSWETGLLKGDGGAFGGLEDLHRRRQWFFVGDNWRSDVLGALAAGVMPILIDRTGKNPARQLIEDVSPLFVLCSADSSIQAHPLIRAKLSEILGVTAETIEAHPSAYLKILEKTAAIRFVGFDTIRIIDSLGELRNLSTR
ncbi:HAD family hydrolase [Pseudomonas sp. EA_65y_Pfl2_P74]|uniref:HAD family hydrolase n=1 Tax=Pseudomonas sp. EA_65y_Pfl2_P74 TaxID=3088694 RepID=UPI0030D7AE76